MKRYIALLLFSLIFCDTARSQSKLNGVYAGLEVSLSVMMGAGMTRTDHTYLFRTDGTFNDQLDKPDWKTRVAGRYEVNGANVTVRWNNAKGSTNKYTIQKNGDYMNAGSYNLLRMRGDNAIPPGFYKFSHMSSMGGMGTGMTYVGAASDAGLYFDGKGNFSNNRSSASVISGNNVGGGTHKESSGGGTYALKDGLLTLNFASGRTETHSFFVRPDDNPIMAVVDGDIYFMDDKKDAPSKAGKAPTSKTNTTGNRPANTNSNAGNTDASATDGHALLMKANAAHGGASLDNIKTVKVSSIVQGLQLTTFIDGPNNRIRLEVRQGQKLSQVRQLENQSGWQWQSNRVTQLPAADVADMTTTFYSGVLGLRKSVVNRFQVVKVQQLQDKYTITCTLDGISYIFVTNSQNQLLGAGDKTAQTMAVSALSDLRNVDGILIPFRENESNGKQKLNIQYTGFEINPRFDDAVWAKPMGN